MLFIVVAQMPMHIAVQERTCRHHLGVEQGFFGQEAMKKPTVSVGPIHHGGNGESPKGMIHPPIFALGDQPMCKPPLSEKSAPVA